LVDQVTGCSGFKDVHDGKMENKKGIYFSEFSLAQNVTTLFASHFPILNILESL